MEGSGKDRFKAEKAALCLHAWINVFAPLGLSEKGHTLR